MSILQKRSPLTKVKPNATIISTGILFFNLHKLVTLVVLVKPTIISSTSKGDFKMTYPSDKRKKSISFHADTWEKISRRKNISGFINNLIRDYFAEQKTPPADKNILQDLERKNKDQEEIIQSFLNCMNSEENFFDFKKGLSIAKRVKAKEE